MANELYFSSEGSLHLNTDDMYNDQYLYLNQKPKIMDYIPPTVITYNVQETNVIQQVSIKRDEIRAIVMELLPDSIDTLQIEITNRVLDNINNNMYNTIREEVENVISNLSVISDEEIDIITSQ